MGIKQITDEQIEEIINCVNSHQTLQIKKILKELPEFKGEERLESLEEFASEVKRRMRSSGKSLSVGVSDFEDLFVKHSISLEHGK